MNTPSASHLKVPLFTPINSLSHSLSLSIVPATPPPSTKVLLILPPDLGFLHSKSLETMSRFAFANQQQNSNNNNALVSGVVCPKPRRLRLLNPSVKESVISSSSSRFQHNYFHIHQTEMRESTARTELLDMILTKECYDGEKVNNLVPSSPPFFCGSPPIRASNPIVQDALFGKEDPNPNPVSHASPSSSGRGSCSRGQKHPAVRVEGFNSHGISAVA